MSFTRETRARCNGCLFANGVWWEDEYGKCDGPLEAHHIIPKQRIKHLPRAKWETAEKRVMLADPRNGVMLCRQHHHLLTVRSKLIPAELIRDETWEFAREYGLEWALDREINRIPAARAPIVKPTMRKKTGRTSRTKGKTGELEVVKRFKEWGWRQAARTQRGAPQTDGDISGVPDFVEVRRRETLAVPAWLAEVREHAGDRPWALIFRRSNEPWTVAVDLDHYLDLLGRANAAENTYD